MNNRLLDLKNLKFEVRDVMRYDDVGDYFENTIIAYDFKDPVLTNAIFLHEFIEYTLIKSSGIDPELIDKFDTDPSYQETYPREYRLYNKYHDLANLIERQFVENLGLNWEDYDQTINMKEVKTAVRNISNELHKEHPSAEKIEKQKQLIHDVFESEQEKKAQSTTSRENPTLE